MVGRENDKTVNVGAGEEVKKIDFTLVPGGVITGRIIDANGKPVIIGECPAQRADCSL